jgi:hypothetical protein
MVVDLDGIRQRLGPKWAYYLRGALTTASDAEFAEICRNLVGNLGMAGGR